jgi:methionine-S-sulfoxide reductase
MVWCVNMKSGDSDNLVVAGGCFWGVEELLRKVPGVLDTEVGYCGGLTPNPNYEMVKTGTTGHAEAVRILFNPDVLTLDALLQLFFRLHDPTTRNRQGGDTGTQYRSAIFYDRPEQEQAGKDAIERENTSGRWSAPVVTTLERLNQFYPAEAYHQDYLQRYPDGYTCHFWRK